MIWGCFIGTQSKLAISIVTESVHIVIRIKHQRVAASARDLNAFLFHAQVKQEWCGCRQSCYLKGLATLAVGIAAP